MKKFWIVPIAALAVGSACGDTPTSARSPLQLADQPRFHAGGGPGNPPHTRMQPSIVAPTTLSFTSGDVVTFEWTAPTNPDFSITHYDYQLTCSPAIAGGSCTSDSQMESVIGTTLKKVYTVSGAGSYTFKVRGAHQEPSDNHASPFVEISITASAPRVDPVAQTIVFTSLVPSPAVYGNTYTVAATGGGSQQPVQFTTAGACSVSGAIVTFTNVGTCEVHADQAGATVGGVEYTAADRKTQTIAVAARPLTVSGITANNKQYDGTTAATLNTSNAALSAALSADVVTLDVSGATGAFDTPAVGNDKVVTISGLALSGSSASKYSVTQPVTTANIGQKLLTVSFTAANKEYDGLTTATITGRTLTGVVSVGNTLEDVSVTNGTGDFSDKNVGSGKTVTATGFSLSGNHAGNYTLGSVTSWTTTADINARLLTASFSVADKVYDGTTTATITGRSIVTVVGTEDVSLAGGTANFDTKFVGTNKTVTATGFSLTGADVGNYTLGTVSSWTATAEIKTMFNPSNFLDPINTSGSRSSFRLGSTIPVKFQLTTLNGAPYVPAAGDAMPTILLTKIDNVAETALNESDVTTTPDVGTAFRFDGQQFILNLGTKVMSAGTWRVVAKLVDGSLTQPVQIDIRSK